MANVRVTICNVDDGATVHLNGDEIMHVDFMKNGSRSFSANEGDVLKLTIQNLTGGAWHTHFRVLVDDQIRFDHPVEGWSWPMQNEAWAYEVVI